MKKSLLTLSVLSLILIFVSCEKEKNFTENYSTHPEIAFHSDDQYMFASEINGVFNDINAALESDADFAGRFQSLQNVACDADVTFEGTSNPRKITITYANSNCDPLRSRTGTIVISMAQGVLWKNAGAAVTVSLQDVGISRAGDGKRITISGSYTYTNTTGGKLSTMPSSGNIKHRISCYDSTLVIIESKRTSWLVDMQRSFSMNNGWVLSVTGLHNEGSNTGIAVWGSNRFGRTFNTYIRQALTYRQDCNFRLTTGKVENATSGYLSTITFGLNALGAPTACPGLNNYYYKVEWPGYNAITKSVLIPY